MNAIDTSAASVAIKRAAEEGTYDTANDAAGAALDVANAYAERAESYWGESGPLESVYQSYWADASHWATISQQWGREATFRAEMDFLRESIS